MKHVCIENTQRNENVIPAPASAGACPRESGGKLVPAKAGSRNPEPFL